MNEFESRTKKAGKFDTSFRPLRTMVGLHSIGKITANGFDRRNPQKISAIFPNWSDALLPEIASIGNVNKEGPGCHLVAPSEFHVPWCQIQFFENYKDETTSNGH
jgi:hypothetical protein